MEKHYRWLAIVLGLLMFAGCASTPKTSAAHDHIAEKDPLEKINRPIFKFNDKLDVWVLKPVAKGYQAVTPDPVERGIGNFFFNLAEVPSALNSVLQWKWAKAGNNTGRFLLNSTIGIGGLFDVAKYTGLQRKGAETFGQTLTYWGLGTGPYLVLPFKGPSTLTDLAALPVDTYTSPILLFDEDAVRTAVYAVSQVDRRAKLLTSDDIVSGDRYTFIREAFLQNREYQVNDGKVEDDFGGDFDDFEDF